MIDHKVQTRIEALDIWTEQIEIEPLSGGLTNVNYLVRDGAAQYVVRLGEDIVEHQVMRFNELAASRAAHQAGISPKVVHAAPGVLVLDYIKSRTFDEQDVRVQGNLERILPLLKSCHREVPRHLRGAALMFWVFHVIRDYGWTLREGESAYMSALPDLLSTAAHLEKQVGPIDMVFGHNDLVCRNILDDGARLWLIDWDYAGFNSPLFDLGGLVSNNELSVRQEVWLLENYYERPLSDDLFARYRAMKCASLLREAMWSMVAERHSSIEFDFGAYTADYLARFERAYRDIN